MSSLVIDAAYPPAAVPAGVSGVMGYVGGAAAHVWTPAEWQPFHAVRQFPIWVAELAESPEVSGRDAAAAVAKLGWVSKPAGTRLIICDLETNVDAAWYIGWATTVADSGYQPVAYGSLSTVLGNAAAANIVADWDGIKSIPAGQTIHGVQYQANVKVGATEVDYDLFDSWLMARGGVGPRHGA
jgi:hypothetical protein